MNPELTFRALALAVQTPGLNGKRGLPVCLWGPPGGAKTSWAKAIAKALEDHFECVIPALSDPTKLGGLPVDRDGTIVLAPPAWAKRLSKAPKGILLLDELSNCPPATQAAALVVLLERKVGDEDLPDGVAIIAAANPPSSSVSGLLLSPPAANRIVHLHTTGPSADQWVDFIAGGNGLLPTIPVVSPEAFRAAWLKVTSIAAAFAKTHALLELPQSEDAAGGPWPSHRSVEMGLRGYAAGLAVDDTAAGELLLSGAVGDKWATSFLAFVAALDLPDPVAVLHDPTLVPADPNRKDRTFTCLLYTCRYAITGSLSPGWDRKDQAAAACKMLVANFDRVTDDLLYFAWAKLNEARNAASDLIDPKTNRTMIVARAEQDLLAQRLVAFLPGAK